jgi:hypothetical protein
MKKSTRITGYLASFIFLAGAIFKMQHWPGAGILFTIGCLAFSFAYAIPLFMEKRKLAADPYSKFITIWILVLMIVLPLAFLFKVQHWPGGGSFALITYVLIAISIPLLILYATRSKDPIKALNIHNEAIVVIYLLSFIIITFSTNISKQVLDVFIPINRTVLKEMKFQEARSNELYATIESAVAENNIGTNFFEKAKEVKNSSDSLCSYIVSLEEMMVRSTGQENWDSDSIELVLDKANIDELTEIFIEPDGPQKGLELKQKLVKYKEMMDQNTNSRGKEIIGLFFNTDDPKSGEDVIYDTWVIDKFYHKPMVSVLVELNQMRSNIRMLEAETMIYLKVLAAKAITNDASRNEKNEKE